MHFPKPEIKLKPWGREIWWAATSKYAGKILEVKKDGRLSLQYHEEKVETQFIFSGEIKLTYGTDPEHLETKILIAGDVFHIEPGTIHRLEGIADVSVIFEVSTPHLEDVVRLADDYGRPEKGNDAELDRKLAD